MSGCIGKIIRIKRQVRTIHTLDSGGYQRFDLRAGVSFRTDHVVIVRKCEADEASVLQVVAREDLGLLRNDYRIKTGMFARIRKVMQYPCSGDGAIEIPLAGSAELVLYIFDQIPMTCDVPVRIATGRASREIDNMLRGVNAANALTGHIP